ncbi:hypothetical protein FGG08_003245 [Glutinoglossum americanum]|uniref:Uncharacterized protein n=1 Tax=Glutinoglossum americanum TaxID=1670608 RepID=A0A9P8I7L4_9PEZI|nr:hypothetical protein FGG08_003245 [Glutinoglossum americanum]
MAGDWRMAEIASAEPSKTELRGKKAWYIVHAVGSATHALPNGTSRLKYSTSPPTFPAKEKNLEPIIDEVMYFIIVLAFNHLKLVVAVPDIDNTATKTEICLAKLASMAAKRKSGRLEVYDSVIEEPLSEHLLKAPSAAGESLPPPPAAVDKADNDGDSSTYDSGIEKKRARFGDVATATAICMVVGERQKRGILLEIVLLAIEGAQNG